jgi:hypothetical protein
MPLALPEVDDVQLDGRRSRSSFVSSATNKTSRSVMVTWHLPSMTRSAAGMDLTHA